MLGERAIRVKCLPGILAPLASGKLNHISRKGCQRRLIVESSYSSVEGLNKTQAARGLSSAARRILSRISHSPA